MRYLDAIILVLVYVGAFFTVGFFGGEVHIVDWAKCFMSVFVTFFLIVSLRVYLTK